MLGRRRILLALSTQSVDLPPGYHQIPYLSTDKDKQEYISTMVYGEENTHIEVDVMPISYPSVGVFVIFSASESSKRFGITARRDVFNGDFGSQLKDLGGVRCEIGKRYKVEKNGLRNFINGIEYTANEGTSAVISERSLIRLSATNVEPNTTNIYPTSLRIYGCKIWRTITPGEASEGDELLRDYIPVSDGTQEALYDTVNKELYFKDGSTEFYHDIDFTFNNIRKKEYFDTGINVNFLQTDVYNINIQYSPVDYWAYGQFVVYGANNNNLYWQLGSINNNPRFYIHGSTFVEPVDADGVKPVYDSKKKYSSSAKNENGILNLTLIEDLDGTRKEYTGSYNFNRGMDDLNRSLWLGGFNSTNDNKQLSGIKTYHVDITHNTAKYTLTPVSNGLLEGFKNIVDGSIFTKKILKQGYVTATYKPSASTGSTKILGSYYNDLEFAKISHIKVNGIVKEKARSIYFSNANENTVIFYFNNEITDLSRMFRDCDRLISVDFSNIDTSSVTNMYAMFDSCSNLTTVNLSGVNTSNVVDMESMFEKCISLTSLDLSMFDTSNVIYMNSMFYRCENLTALDLSNFNTSNVITMSNMFERCEKLTTLNISSFDTSKVTYMNYMFDDCYALTSLDVSRFNTSNVTSMNYMFNDCNALTVLDISSFDTSKVENMSYMFGLASLTSLDISNLNTSNVTDMSGMFAGCSSLTSLDISTLDMSNVMYISYMFSYCSSLTSLDISHINLSKVTNIDGLFNLCSSLTEIDLSTFDTSNIITMRYLFNGCTGLKSLDISSLNTSNVIGMDGMFSQLALTSLDLSSLDTSKVENMSYMFQNSTSLTDLDLSTFNTSNVDSMFGMFLRCTNLQYIKLMGDPSKAVNATGYPPQGVDMMFEGVAATGVLEYNSAYDYSKIIAELPTGWTATAI